jgi:hypothetical protein
MTAFFLYLWALKVKSMKQKVTALVSTAGDYAKWILLSLVGTFIMCALLFQVTMIGLEVAGKTETTRAVANWFSWKFDGTFKNSPGNIWYEEPKEIYVSSVNNYVKVGKLAGNRNLEFGVKNILEEYLQEKGYDLSPLASNRLDVDIVYLDVLTTKSSVSVFHKNNNEVVIRLRGTLFKEGTKVKEVLVEESSSEISMSTLIVDQGGKFNQTSLSNSLKKGCDKLITKLFEK